MPSKDTAKQIIDTLPNTATMDDIMQALYVSMKFEQGEREICEGKGIPHNEAKKKLEKWLQ